MEETMQQDALDRWAAMWAIFFAVLAGMAAFWDRAPPTPPFNYRARPTSTKWK